MNTLVLIYRHSNQNHLSWTSRASTYLRSLLLVSLLSSHTLVHIRSQIIPILSEKYVKHNLHCLRNMQHMHVNKSSFMSVPLSACGTTMSFPYVTSNRRHTMTESP